MDMPCPVPASLALKGQDLTLWTQLSHNVAGCLYVGRRSSADLKAFGIVTGALSVAALFNSCVDCFDYIQLGRRFGHDYPMCQLKLDVARARLSRWGEAACVNEDAVFDTNTPDAQTIQLAQSILEEIHDLFQAAYKTSRRYERTAKPEDLVLCEEKDLTLVFSKLHDRLKGIAHRRQNDTGLVKKTTWALHDGRELERTIDRITGFVDDLEKLFPVEATCRRLAEMEIEGVEDESALAVLNEAAQNIDKTMLDATAQKVQAIASRNFAEEVRGAGNADVQVGNQYSDKMLLCGVAITEQTSNAAEVVDAKDTAKVQIGGRFGPISPEVQLRNSVMIKMIIPIDRGSQEYARSEVGDLATNVSMSTNMYVYVDLSIVVCVWLRIWGASNTSSQKSVNDTSVLHVQNFLLKQPRL
ncbi:small s protein [Colletotrichum kahawae]|uniref:Small s protein n=1 Tax=Colletotrichum kahawae TaxID=34407 RepID=A0AAD9YMK1_COLKA|nr:small s protein [Colletotrichum kahawae]